jgi:hypothetical protein
LEKFFGAFGSVAYFLFRFIPGACLFGFGARESCVVYTTSRVPEIETVALMFAALIVGFVLFVAPINETRKKVCAYRRLYAQRNPEKEMQVEKFSRTVRFFVSLVWYWGFGTLFIILGVMQVMDTPMRQETTALGWSGGTFLLFACGVLCLLAPFLETIKKFRADVRARRAKK